MWTVAGPFDEDSKLLHVRRAFWVGSADRDATLDRAAAARRERRAAVPRQGGPPHCQLEPWNGCQRDVYISDSLSCTICDAWTIGSRLKMPFLPTSHYEGFMREKVRGALTCDARSRCSSATGANAQLSRVKEAAN